MSKPLLKIFVRSIATLLGLAMLFSCKTDLETIETITKTDDSPLEIIHNIEIFYSKHGRMQARMQSPLMKTFGGENAHTEMPEGFIMFFFDDDLKEESRISAQYAIQYEKEGLIDARKDVIVENFTTQEKLNTEQLIWNREEGIIYTEKFVKITQQEDVLYGDGFRSDDRFTDWVIENPRGTFTLETEDTEEENQTDTILPSEIN